MNETLGYKKIHEISSEHLKHHLRTTGNVIKSSKVTPIIIEGCYMCARCGFENRVQEGPSLNGPYECEGCEKLANQTTFHLMREKSIIIDSQRFLVEDDQFDYQKGDELRVLSVVADGEMVNRMKSGDHVTLYGKLDLSINPKKREQEFLFHLEGVEIIKDE